MQIELLQRGKMTTSGSSVLKMMQNNNIPSLDLIVRESVQNSLDAALRDSNDVYMFFRNYSFDVVDLANEFPSIKDKLINKFGYSKAKYLSIRDTNTVGLTGNLDGDFGPKEKNQNLGKLVFHIMDAQETEGAGGSWGIGKTVYYRIGIGLTIYYSQIKKENNEFEERLVAVLVEDERKEGLLSDFDNELGIAFFGELNSKNNTEAITDKEKIHRFLNIFGIAPFPQGKTGTEIIIPFIDEEQILKTNNFEDQSHWWETSIEQYITTALLRWYFPRMTKGYIYGPKLVPYINNKSIDINRNDLILFKKYQELYDSCYEKDYPEWIKKEKITRKKNLENSEIGTFVYGLVSKDELNMNAPYTLPNPFQYVLIDETSDIKKPLICFTRKPGMIINYFYKDNGLSSINCNKENCYIIGLFVLNSNNVLIYGENKLNLDEYVRRSEKSDHTSWTDYAIEKGKNQIQIVGNIYKQIENILSREYNKTSELTGESSMYLDLSRKFAKLFMPPEGFGNKGSKPPEKRNRGGGGIVAKNEIAKIEFINRKFEEENIVLSYNIKFIKQKCKIIFTHHVVTENGEVNMKEYELHFGDCPFEINKAAINYQIYKKYEMKVINLSKGLDENNIKIKPIYSIDSSKCLGLEIDFDNNNITELKLNISLITKDKLIKLKPNFDIKEDI